jgi:hypothetical protein
MPRTVVKLMVDTLHQAGGKRIDGVVVGSLSFTQPNLPVKIVVPIVVLIVVLNNVVLNNGTLGFVETQMKANGFVGMGVDLPCSTWSVPGKHSSATNCQG